MKRTIPTSIVTRAWQVLGASKYGKLSDDEKIKVWKISRVLQPVAKQFNEESKDAADKLKPSEDFQERLAKAQAFEMAARNPKLDTSKLEMGAAEYQEFMAGDYQRYNQMVNEALKESAMKDVEIDIEPLTEETFVKLMNSNDWTFDVVQLLGDILCE
jgi:hypothetical protein